MDKAGYSHACHRGNLDCREHGSTHLPAVQCETVVNGASIIKTSKDQKMYSFWRFFHKKKKKETLGEDAAKETK